MSDATPTFPLPPDWRQKAIDRLNGLVQNGGACPACGPAGIGKVIAAEHLVTPTSILPDATVQLGGTNYPQLMLLCTNCGFTRNFNYLLLMADRPEAPSA